MFDERSRVARGRLYLGRHCVGTGWFDGLKSSSDSYQFTLYREEPLSSSGKRPSDLYAPHCLCITASSLNGYDARLRG